MFALVQVNPLCNRRHVIIVYCEHHVIALLYKGMRRPSIRGSQGQPGYIMTEVVEQVRPVAPIAGRKRQGVKVVADAEAVGNCPAGGNGPERGEADTVAAEVVEQVRPV